MADYFLRNVEPDLWRKFKKRAASEGHKLRWLFLEFIRRYVADGLK